MFPHAKNVVITGGQFTIAENNQDAVSTILWQHVAAGAIFDSAERYPPGKCHPKTRRKVIDQMTSWIKDPNLPQHVLWMYGPAGSGKSALMQSLCELLRDSYPGLKGGSFFFSKGHLVRGNATKLFVTLAYQLAIQFPAVRAVINDALVQDPSLPTKSMDIQLKALIIDPLLRCPDFPTTPPTLFIDGLDECDSDRTQRQIITLILNSIIKHDIPLRFIIASRPEYWIRDAFETSPFPDTIYSLSLRDDIDADKDIKAYMTDGFEKIRKDNRRIMGSVKLPWPPERVINRFVYEASGQYIYASTILKFVGNDSLFNDPQEQLKILLNSGPDRAPAFTELDRLYQTILSVYRRWERMKRVLAGLVMGVNLAFIRVLLGVPQTELTLALDALSSLIDITPPKPLSEDGELLTLIFGSSLEDEEISFCHLSFREFLLDKGRSGLYHVDVAAIHGEAINAFFTVIWRNMDNNYEIEPHISFNTSVLEYRRMMQGLVQVGAFWDYNIQELLPTLNSMMERFRRFDPGRRMNYPACFMRDMQSLSDLLRWWDYRKHNVDSDDEYGEEQYSDLLDSGSSAIYDQLRDFALMARKIGIHLLLLSDGFSVTRTLFCIGHMSWKKSSRIKIQDLLRIPGSTIAGTLSTIRKHHHIIELRYNRPKNMLPPPGIDPSSIFMPSWMDPASMFLVDLPERLDDTRIYWPDSSNDGELVDLKATIDVGWLCRREWANQYVSLVCDFLKSFTIHLDNDWEHLACTSEFYFRVNVKDAILKDFFNSDDLSDIRGEGYFENKYHISLLEIMADSEAWIAVLPLRPKLWTNMDSIITPILGWFDRQLTNPTALTLMEEHDVSLPQKLTTTMNCIFQHCFIPIFRTPYFSDLVISTLPEEDAKKTVRLKVVRLNLFEVEAGFIPCEDHRFSVPNFLMRKDPPPPIPTSEWYTCLGAYILNTMVKGLYRETHPEFGQQGAWQSSLFISSREDPHTATTFFQDLGLECLEYALTTSQNLDALRAIKHLYWKVDHKIFWFGIWTQSISPFRKLLKEYEPSVLSPDELSDFEYWLRDIEESYEPMIPYKEEQSSTSSKELGDLYIDREECGADSTSVDADL